MQFRWQLLSAHFILLSKQTGDSQTPMLDPSEKVGAWCEGSRLLLSTWWHFTISTSCASGLQASVQGVTAHYLIICLLKS